jgi:hypothetical protein
VATGIVSQDKVFPPQRGHQERLYVSGEADGIDRLVKQARDGVAVAPQRGSERLLLAVPV